MAKLATGAAMAAVLFSAGCAGLTMEDILRGLQDETVYGEVRSVDTRRGELRIREDYGDDRTLYFDSRTRVEYERRTFPVSALERGDQVHVRVSYDERNRPWAEHIELRGGDYSRDDRTRDRDDDHDRVQRIDARVARIDTRRGWFSIDNGWRGSLTVYLPARPRSDDVRTFQRLRRGDRVRADVRATTRGTAELVRFR